MIASRDALQAQAQRYRIRNMHLLKPHSILSVTVFYSTLTLLFLKRSKAGKEREMRRINDTNEDE